MSIRKLIYLSFLFLICQHAHADYYIHGTVNMKGEWQNQIYLATIDKLDDYYNANSESIINVSPIDENGNFELRGNNLPDAAQFYRLYLVKEQHSEFNACLFVGGDEHNFIHLILNNASEIEISANLSSYAPFGDFELKGDIENHLMKKVGRLVYPSYLFYEIKFPSELQFSQNKLNRDLFQFSDTCQHILPSLAALNNTDFDSYFETDFHHYEKLANKLKRDLPNHPYTKNYLRKLSYYSDGATQSTSLVWQLISAGLFLALLLLAFKYWKLSSSLQKENGHKQNIELKDFTPQELKILQLIKEGNSNKEIASELFIELSTVKSHINKLYSKLQVKNRSEAIQKSKILNL